MKNIRIEEVGDINSDFPYLEVFFKNEGTPFMEVSVSQDKELSFKLCAIKDNILLQKDEWEHILEIAKSFLPRVLKNEEDYLKFLKE